MSTDVFEARKLEKTTKLLTNPFSFRAFTFSLMPLGFVAGLHVKKLDENMCEVAIPGGWRTQNPFKSMYWAAQGMAAELAAGLHPALYTKASSVPVTMILAECHGGFKRQCIGKARFRCEDGEAIRKVVAETAVTGERLPCKVKVVGIDPDDKVVSEWEFVWSFKGKPEKKPVA